MGYTSYLGTGAVAGLHPMLGWPMDRWGHILYPASPFDGIPVPDWDKPGTVLANMTSPYRFLHFAVGTGDDFVCFDYRTFNQGPLGEHIILHATMNCETASFIDGFAYKILPVRSMDERKLAIRAAEGLVDQALDWAYNNDIKHTVRGWNQDPRYFVRSVALSLVPWLGVKKKFTARQIRKGGRTIDAAIYKYVWGDQK
jgi:hypothetical protein